ncbi:MAG: biopolymer transporter ExbD, partial [Nitrospirota bacterium]|nr:biopolymer transporter ExbD [Nitrospirota bacterium]
MIFEARRRRFLAEINVIPLVDVMLVLLVIFMVTAPMLHRGMDIKLPRSVSNTIQPEERIVLTIEPDQKLYLDNDLVSVAQLGIRL